MRRAVACISLSLCGQSAAGLTASLGSGACVPHPWRCRRLSMLASPTAKETGTIQRVYELASAGDLDGACKAMDDVTAVAAALAPGTGAGSAANGPICYHHIYSDTSLSMSIFVLPPGGCIPLHDHPGMTVLSKLLFGSLRVVSYDMPASRLGATQRHLLCAPATSRTVDAPCSTLRLDAEQGNIHAFEALSHTAIFDVLTPPYNDREGRSCHYYVEEESGRDGALLREVPWPDSLKIVNRPYEGEPVQPAAGGRLRGRLQLW